MIITINKSHTQNKQQQYRQTIIYCDYHIQYMFWHTHYTFTDSPTFQQSPKMWQYMVCRKKIKHNLRQSILFEINQQPDQLNKKRSFRYFIKRSNLLLNIYIINIYFLVCTFMFITPLKIYLNFIIKSRQNLIYLEIICIQLYIYRRLSHWRMMFLTHDAWSH